MTVSPRAMAVDAPSVPPVGESFAAILGKTSVSDEISAGVQFDEFLFLEISLFSFAGSVVRSTFSRPLNSVAPETS